MPEIQTSPLETTNLENLSLHILADRIRREWGPKMYFGAVPYVDAMATVSNVSDSYGFDDGKSIVLYFLANATTWRGPVAKAIKAELKRRVAACR